MPLKLEVLLEETLQKLEDQQKQKRVLHVISKVWNKAPEKIRTSKMLTAAKNGNPRALQVTPHLGLAIQSK
jgi:hypothetical protein